VRFSNGLSEQTLLERHWSRLRKCRQSSDWHRTALWTGHCRSHVHRTTATYDIRLIHDSRSSHNTDSMKFRTFKFNDEQSLTYYVTDSAFLPLIFYVLLLSTYLFYLIALGCYIFRVAELWVWQRARISF